MNVLELLLGLFGMVAILGVGLAFVAFPEEMLKLRFAHLRSTRRYVTSTRVTFYRLVGLGVVVMGLLALFGYLF
ncbi:hypothetical protein [Haloarchaeobius sp. HME9146]|uniref:hypothetical protein n=1 Tax=Haloarchaeobius sp. HME9146 TaxID=2978732 RepID=UPI0021C0EB55|nr:hypothetical protein [Haloarchaeobius sp. HME9146]MCT9094869.1 hypothetical protein [Haloarchaeobius sp. HME9146]